MAVPKQTCRGCGAEVVWIRSEKGRACICDAKPVSGMTAEGKVEKVWLSHWSSCPDAAKFRKAQAKAAVESPAQATE